MPEKNHFGVFGSPSKLENCATIQQLRYCLLLLFFHGLGNGEFNFCFHVYLL
jgi:hypothetical protein